MLDCKIISAQGAEDHPGLNSVTLPALNGQMQILPGHAEIFLLLAKGDIVLSQNDGQTKTIPITDGECHILNDLVSIIL